MTIPKEQGCCSACGGSGIDTASPETNGKCWDCHGTGHAHDPRQVCEQRLYVQTWDWCPYGERLRNPSRRIVRFCRVVDGKLEAISGYIRYDTTTPQAFVEDIPPDKLNEEWRNALKHFGGGWDGPLAKTKPEDL